MPMVLTDYKISQKMVVSVPKKTVGSLLDQIMLAVLAFLQYRHYRQYRQMTVLLYLGNAEFDNQRVILISRD